MIDFSIVELFLLLYKAIRWYFYIIQNDWLQEWKHKTTIFSYFSVWNLFSWTLNKVLSHIAGTNDVTAIFWPRHDFRQPIIRYSWCYFFHVLHQHIPHQVFRLLPVKAEAQNAEWPPLFMIGTSCLLIIWIKYIMILNFAVSKFAFSCHEIVTEIFLHTLEALSF